MQQAEDFSGGVPVIDKGHRKLAAMLGNLRAAIRAQVCRYTIENTLALLEEYVELHFHEEEQYMKDHGYQDYALHKEQHENFATELHFLEEELRSIRALGLRGSYELSVETVQVITDWISGHVLQDDTKFGEFMRQHSGGNVEGGSSLCGSEVPVIDGFVSICAICHKILGKKGLWKERENYREIPSDILYSHGLCPECLQNYYADLFHEKREQ
jgi:hemerythrin